MNFRFVSVFLLALISCKHTGTGAEISQVADANSAAAENNSQGLSLYEKRLIRIYSGNSFDVINNFSRGNYFFTVAENRIDLRAKDSAIVDAKSQAIRRFTEQFFVALNKLPSAVDQSIERNQNHAASACGFKADAKNGVFLRGSINYSGFDEKFAAGKLFLTQNVTSTSNSYDVAHNFAINGAGTVDKEVEPKDFRIIEFKTSQARGIASFSAHVSESEYLIPAGVPFKITKVIDDPAKLPRWNPTTNRLDEIDIVIKTICAEEINPEKDATDFAGLRTLINGQNSGLVAIPPIDLKTEIPDLSASTCQLFFKPSASQKKIDACLADILCTNTPSHEEIPWTNPNPGPKSNCTSGVQKSIAQKCGSLDDQCLVNFVREYNAAFIDDDWTKITFGHQLSAGYARCRVKSRNGQGVIMDSPDCETNPEDHPLVLTDGHPVIRKNLDQAESGGLDQASILYQFKGHVHGEYLSESVNNIDLDCQ